MRDGEIKEVTLPTPELRWSEYQIPLGGPSIPEAAVRLTLGYHGTMRSPDAPQQGAIPGAPPRTHDPARSVPSHSRLDPFAVCRLQKITSSSSEVW